MCKNYKKCVCKAAELSRSYWQLWTNDCEQLQMSMSKYEKAVNAVIADVGGMVYGIWTREIITDLFDAYGKSEFELSVLCGWLEAIGIKCEVE